MTALLVVALVVAAGMFGVYGWLGAIYQADEETAPIPSYDRDTEPWPAPR